MLCYNSPSKQSPTVPVPCTRVCCNNKWTHPRHRVLFQKCISLPQGVSATVRGGWPWCSHSAFRLLPSCGTFSPMHYVNTFHSMGECPGRFTLSIKSHFCHWRHDPFRMKGAGRDKHPLHRKSKKTLIQTTCSEEAHRSLKQQIWLSPLQELQCKQEKHIWYIRNKCQRNSNGDKCLEGNRILNNE